MIAATPSPRPPRVLVPLHATCDSPAPRGAVRSLHGTCMGTGWSVRYVASDATHAECLRTAIVDLLEGLECQMSHRRPHSDLQRFAALPAGAAMRLPPEFACVLRGACEVARDSGGAFDPTLAPVIDAWGFGAGLRFHEAGFSMDALASLSARKTGWRHIAIDDDNRILQPGGLALNLSAIAKGYAVDAVSALLTRRGLPDHLVEIGGELRGHGVKPDGQPWWVALELPAADCGLPRTRIALHGLAVATSGDYRQRYRIGEHRVHHTLDPRTRMPTAHGLASVSVLHADCMRADAWATALMVLGPVEGLALAELRELPALLQWRAEDGTWMEASSHAFRTLQS